MTKPRGAGRGRVKGSKNKATLEREAALAAEEAARAGRKGGRLRAKLEEGLTDEEILGLSPELKARLLTSLQPKEPPVPVGNTFSLIVQGLDHLPFPVACPKCAMRFMAKPPVTPQGTPGSGESGPAQNARRADLPAAHRGPTILRSEAYVPDEGASAGGGEAGLAYSEDWPNFVSEEIMSIQKCVRHRNFGEATSAIEAILPGENQPAVIPATSGRVLRRSERLPGELREGCGDRRRGGEMNDSEYDDAITKAAQTLWSLSRRTP
jgi:hypothetical protein